jgi:hypothetical protein
LGALIVVVVDDSTATTTGTVSDSVNAGNYSHGTAVQLGRNGGGAGSANYYYMPNSAALTGATITYTTTGGANSKCISTLYATGIRTSLPLDTNVLATLQLNSVSANPAFSLTSGTPSVSGDLMIAFTAMEGYTGGPSNPLSQDTGNGWTVPPAFVVDSSNFGCYLFGGYQVNAGSGTKVYAPGNSGLLSIFGAAFIIGFEAIAATTSPFIFSTFP